MSMQSFTSNADHVRSVLRDAIQNGVYPPGSSLPSTRELAAQFHINRNTAQKIYHELAGDELIRLIPSRPPVVISNAPRSNLETFQERARQVIKPILLEHQLSGLTETEARATLTDIVDDAFDRNGMRRIFIAECNLEEAQAYAQSLTLQLGTIVQPILLEELPGVGTAEIVISPYFHVNEARRALQGNPARVTGLIVSADSSDIARVASMVSDGPLGVIARKMDAALRLQRLLEFQISAPMVSACTDDPETIDAMRDNVECIATTVRAFDLTRPMFSETPIASVRYHPDERSISALQSELRRLETPARSRR